MNFQARIIIFFIASILFSIAAQAQDNYEIQVYPSELVEKGITMIELHSNFTALGSTMINDGVRPTQGAFHETLEITHGFADWLEVGFYCFTSTSPGYGFNWVGDHIRPRITAPESWKLPVGLSLSTEIGYQRREYCTNTFNFEVRPIIDKKFDRFYFSINPALEYSFAGLDAGKPGIFSPAFKAGYDVSKKVTLGVEYYGSMGYLSGFDPLTDQEHYIYPSADLNLSPDWELNFGVGFGLTHASDPLIFKLILGRRLGKK